MSRILGGDELPRLILSPFQRYVRFWLQLSDGDRAGFDAIIGKNTISLLNNDIGRRGCVIINVIRREDGSVTELVLEDLFHGVEGRISECRVDDPTRRWSTLILSFLDSIAFLLGAPNIQLYDAAMKGEASLKAHLSLIRGYGYYEARGYFPIIADLDGLSAYFNRITALRNMPLTILLDELYRHGRMKPKVYEALKAQVMATATAIGTAREFALEGDAKLTNYLGISLLEYAYSAYSFFKTKVFTTRPDGLWTPIVSTAPDGDASAEPVVQMTKVTLLEIQIELYDNDYVRGEADEASLPVLAELSYGELVRLAESKGPDSRLAVGTMRQAADLLRRHIGPLTDLPDQLLVAITYHLDHPDAELPRGHCMNSIKLSAVTNGLVLSCGPASVRVTQRSKGHSEALFFVHGVMHRDGGPALLRWQDQGQGRGYRLVEKYYYWGGTVHRIGGPAKTRILEDGSIWNGWYLYGEPAHSPRV